MIFKITSLIHFIIVNVMRILKSIKNIYILVLKRKENNIRIYNVVYISGGKHAEEGPKRIIGIIKKRN